MKVKMFLLLVSVAACAAWAVEYNPKDEAELKACLPKLRPGDVVNLVPGRTYRTAMVIRRSGTVDKPIVVKGNGAVLDGLAPIPDGSWVPKGNGLFLSPNNLCRGANFPRVCDRNGKLMKVVNKNVHKVKPESLKPGEANWDKHGAWYRVKEGEKSPAGLGLTGYYQSCGIDICHHSHIHIENLTAQHFANDAFNVHGRSYGLIFRNICGRHCGDDGFSVHEDVQAVVYGGHFHDCDDGIHDIQASQTTFFGCTVESNRLWGVGFSGGYRGMFDSVVRGNDGDQVWVGTSHIGKPYRFSKEVPLIRGGAYFKNVKIGDGKELALRVNPGAEVSCDLCVFHDTSRGVEVRKGGALHLSRCRFGNVTGAEFTAPTGAVLFVDGVRTGDGMPETCGKER